MTIFTALDTLKQQPANKQQAFQAYAADIIQNRLVPLFADLSLLVAIVSALLFILGLAQGDAGINGIHPLVFVYLGVMILLAVIHRTTRLRLHSPWIVYLMFSTMALFGYLDYMVKGGDYKTLLGLFFFLSSVGLITFSVKHSVILLMINGCLLTLATLAIPNIDSPAQHIIELISNWLIVSCMVLSPAWAVFNRWLFRNILALQFMLKDTNEQLTKALVTLKETESKLIHQQKHQALNHMAAGLLHEIINPVNSSIQAIDYAISINNDDELNDVLKDALEQQTRVVTTVEELKAFSKPNPTHEKSLENFSELLKTARHLCRNELSNIQVINRSPENLSLNCYPTACIQVLVNLFHNSIKAIKLKADKSVSSTESPLSIEIDSVCKDDSITLIVKDNGIGIAAHDITKISDPFYSTDDTPDRLGLGLSICQTIMRHHNGLLEIDSDPGNWTQVSLTFPR